MQCAVGTKCQGESGDDIMQDSSTFLLLMWMWLIAGKEAKTEKVGGGFHISAVEVFAN